MIKDHIGKDGIIYWEYEPQTKKKHEIFKDYLEKWIWIKGVYGPINYFDCFGGCGKYVDEKGNEFFGSPILAAQLIIDNIEKRKRTVGLVIIEKEKKYLDNLNKLFHKLNLKINPEFKLGNFDIVINTLLDEHKNLAPTLFFIDPFGFSDIKLETIKKIMSRKGSEIVLNFMFNSVSRFLEIEKNEESLNDLFGSDEWKNCFEKEGLCREKEIIGLLNKRLQDVAKYVTYFKFSFGNMNRTYYYIFHLTNHEKGCNIFKSCVRKYCGGFEFKGKLHSQQNLYDFTNEIEESIKKILMTSYNQREISFLQIFKEKIHKIKGTEGDLKRALISLENANKIEIKRKNPITKKGNERKSIINEDFIIFK